MVLDSRVLSPKFDLFEDDSEETLVGSSSHQGAIVALVEGIGDSAAQRDLPWFVCNQLTLVLPRRGEYPPAQPAPDICVHPTLMGAQRTALLVAIDGPPALIIEVTSPSTALRRDLNMNSGAGKPLLYEAIGVREYLVFDPHAEYLGAQVWARRLGPHGYAPWPQSDDGRWHSQTLGISFAPQGFLLRVFDHDGELVPLHQELRDENADLRGDNAALRAQLAALEAALRQQRGE